MDKMKFKEIEDKFSHRSAGVIGTHRFFSVMIPLVVREDESYIGLEVRAKTLNRQPGDICFPGGALEQGEDGETCAVRETMEELGLKREAIHVLGPGDTLHTTANFTMYSYVARVEERQIRINKDEVEELFFVPLSFFLNNEPAMHGMTMLPQVDDHFPHEKIQFGRGYRWRTGYAEIPVYEFENKIIWGITGRIIRNFVQIIQGERL